MSKTHLILIAHGSKDQRWREPFEKIVSEIGNEAGTENVSLCYMEFAKPTIEDVIEIAIKNNFISFKILPLFMSNGGHVSNDIVSKVQELNVKYPSIEIKLLSAICEDPLIMGAIVAIASSYIKT